VAPKGLADRSCVGYQCAGCGSGKTVIVDDEIVNHVCPVESYEAEDCRDLVSAVHGYLATFAWAKPTGRIWVGECIPAVIGIFLVELEPSESDIDHFTWVIVGDLPPAYLSPVYAKSPREALNGYIAEMSAWVEAIERNQPTDALIPVNAAPTIENASSLKSRLNFLGREILPQMAG
jgi:hypothetical protein